MKEMHSKTHTEPKNLTIYELAQWIYGDLFKRSETKMSKQSLDSLNTRSRNTKSNEIPNIRSKTCKSIEKESAVFTDNLSEHNSIDTVAANGFELFTRFAYCQALLYKAWVEASDKLADKVMELANHDHNDPKQPVSLYIDTFEETFTNLFRSPEFASNLAKLLTSLAECMKVKDDLPVMFPNNLLKITENAETIKDLRMAEAEQGD